MGNDGVGERSEKAAVGLLKVRWCWRVRRGSGEVRMGNRFEGLDVFVLVKLYRAVRHNLMPHPSVGDFLFVVCELSEHFLQLCNGLTDDLAFTAKLDIVNVFG